MIEKIRIRGFRKFRDISFIPHPRFNLLVGANESGKTTLLEAVGLALTGRVNGRPAHEELNPFWFNQMVVSQFFTDRAQGRRVKPPEISIDLFLKDHDAYHRDLSGAHNSEGRVCSGVSWKVVPDDNYCDELEMHFSSDVQLIPVEYYKIDWRTFSDTIITTRLKATPVAIIDSRTIRSTSGVDYHLRKILDDHLDPDEKAQVSVAFRQVKNELTKQHLRSVNAKIAGLSGALDDVNLSLEMDQTSRSSWDSSVVPLIGNIPFGMAGQGQQASVKIALAMSRNTNYARIVMIEEPENHLSHTRLSTLLSRIETLTGAEQQLFVTTHSSFVLNRLGLDGLVLISESGFATFNDLSPDTVAYFRKLPGYDTLRMVLADRFVLVEGPSDEIVFERLYSDSNGGRRPIQDGIDVISMRGLSTKRCLELAKVLGKHCAVLQDNDGKDPIDLQNEVSSLTDQSSRKLFVGQPDSGFTLEPQLLAVNSHLPMHEILQIAPRANAETWMTNNKTEAALRIADSKTSIVAPSYISEAIDFIRSFV